MMCKKTKAIPEEKKHPSVTTSVFVRTPKPVAAERPIVRGKPSEPSCKFN
ncbi:hypothetical protein C2845_PM18G03000 [Panicum miliaceum]|uniref:Uncharacterized protein n=1 Tax=Panicum miliaceum TaxID=4540 RepID=A0A3L6PI79_PANMI|nr:hypothetical protein C2845_PM18G03000 [Panicum miliaceum]